MFVPFLKKSNLKKWQFKYNLTAIIKFISFKIQINNLKKTKEVVKKKRTRRNKQNENE